MPTKLINAAWLDWPETQALVKAFSDAGLPLRFVGGAVRDALLNRPVMDVDAATPAPPQKVMSLLEAAGIRAIPTGLSHGTITAVFDGKPFEITTLRRDIKNFGRHAEVLFTDSWEEDAARRDFTMNALYCDPDGVLTDYFGGIADAKAGHVLFIGEARERIREDGLRILRFFRFHAHYGEGAIDPAGLEACRAEKQLIEKLSGERVSAEMLKLLAAERAPEVLEEMRAADVLGEVMPGVWDVSPLHALARVRLMADLDVVDPLLALAVLLRGCDPRHSPVKSLATRWKLSNKQAELLHFLAQTEAIAPEADEAGQKKLLRRMGADYFLALVVVSWCDRLIEQPGQPQILSAAYRAMLGLPDRWEPPVFPVSGADLRSLGMLPGPKMGEALGQLERIWEEEHYRPTKEMLLDQLQLSTNSH